MPDTGTELRPRGEVETTYQRLAAEHAAVLDSGHAYASAPYSRGQLAALAWVLGTTNLAPLTDQAGVDVTDTWALAREQFLATGMLAGRAEMDRRGQSYIVGVEHALMWVHNQTDTRLYPALVVLGRGSPGLPASRTSAPDGEARPSRAVPRSRTCSGRIAVCGHVRTTTSETEGYLCGNTLASATLS